MRLKTYNYGYGKIQGAETKFISRMIFLIKNFF